METKPTIKIGEKTYGAKYTFGSYLLMHEKHGINVFDLPEPTPRMMAVLIWGAIIHVDPLITPDDIANRITMVEAMEGNKTCVALIMASMPKAPEDESVAKVTS